MERLDHAQTNVATKTHPTPTQARLLGAYEDQGRAQRVEAPSFDGPLAFNRQQRASRCTAHPALVCTESGPTVETAVSSASTDTLHTSAS